MTVHVRTTRARRVAKSRPTRIRNGRACGGDCGTNQVTLAGAASFSCRDCGTTTVVCGRRRIDRSTRGALDSGTGRGAARTTRLLDLTRRCGTSCQTKNGRNSRNSGTTSAYTNGPTIRAFSYFGLLAIIVGRSKCNKTE